MLCLCHPLRLPKAASGDGTPSHRRPASARRPVLTTLTVRGAGGRFAAGGSSDARIPARGAVTVALAARPLAYVPDPDGVPRPEPPTPLFSQAIKHNCLPLG